MDDMMKMEEEMEMALALLQNMREDLRDIIDIIEG